MEENKKENDQKQYKNNKNKKYKNEHKKTVEMENSQEHIPLSLPYTRMKEVFSKYSDRNFSSEQIISAFGNSFNNNPFVQSERLKRRNAIPKANTKQAIASAMNDPQNHEQLLCSESQALYFQNYVYNYLLKINREVPKFYNYAVPVNVTAEDCKKDEFRKEMQFVNEILNKLNLKKIGKDIALDIAIQGKRSYVFRTSYNKNKGDVNYAILQKLPSDWVKYTKVGSNTDYVTSFDFMMFMQPGESIDFYPEFFKEMWNDLVADGVFSETKDGKYKLNPNNAAKKSEHRMLEVVNNKYMYWVELPQTEVFQFGSDNSNSFALPDCIGLFSDLRGLDDYKWLQNQLLSKAVNSVLVATVPLIKDHNTPGGDQTAISIDTIIGMTDMFTQATNSNIMPFFAPFEDYELLSLPLPPEAKEINNTALKNLIDTSGMGALVSTSDKPSIISVKTAQILAESKAEYLTLQLQSCVNNIINKIFHLKYKYKISIWGGAFTSKEDEKVLKELVISGYTSLLPRLLSMEDQTIEDMVSISNYMESLEIYSHIKPQSLIANENKMSEEVQNYGEEKVVGRHNLGDDIENDNTETSRNQGGNISETKEFTDDTNTI